jgi:hypothetical protein
MTKLALIALWAGLASVAHAAPITPGTFSSRAAVTLTGDGPFHQLSLPLPVYQGVKRQDLGDLRVFNGKGETVPHALFRPESSAVSKAKETRAALFPITATGDTQGDLAVTVRRSGEDTLVAVRQPSRPQPNAIVRGVVFDVSRAVPDERHSLRLQTGTAPTPFHPFTLETSEDLQNWRMLRRDAQIVQLEHSGQRIDNNSISWDGAAGKYLRLLWETPEQAPAINAAFVGATLTERRAAPLLWTAGIAPAQAENANYDFVLPGQMPLERLRIGLPESNTLVSIKLLQYHEGNTRRNRQGSWTGLAQANVYRLKSLQGEVLSPDIVLERPAVQRLRLAIDARSGGLGTSHPSIQIGFVPHVLVFLARGEGPFSLAWGSPSAADAALAVNTLIPNYRDGQPLPASPATLEAASAMAAPSIAPGTGQALPSPVSKGVLWGVLVAGVLILGAMAAVLLRQMKRKDEPLS